MSAISEEREERTSQNRRLSASSSDAEEEAVADSEGVEEERVEEVEVAEAEAGRNLKTTSANRGGATISQAPPSARSRDSKIFARSILCFWTFARLETCEVGFGRECGRRG